MAESRAAGWEKLKCTCGCAEFVAKVSLNWRAGGGTTTSPAGYQCRDFGADVDAAGLIRVAERAQQRAELVRLQAELGEPGPPAPPRAAR